uniref:Uncharacterized protein n=1 Tax=Siphoviridae sp. ct7EW56 TaxID=2827562 RepID=A0A8S5LRR6_9CAUD|nr:MAG TPA: hypothetical protein [Siphoviridae sp. ct7EW56]
MYICYVQMRPEYISSQAKARGRAIFERSPVRCIF